MENFNDFVYFVLVKNGSPRYGFTGYDDKQGNIHQIFKGRQNYKTGKPEPHKFKFDRSHRTIRVSTKDKCNITGELVVDFLRNHPECYGSPNGTYQEINGQRVQANLMFKEMNEEKDAQLAVAAKELKHEAESIAINLDGEELRSMAVLCGYLDQKPVMQKHRVIEYAGANPEQFIAMYKSSERDVRAQLRAAVDANVILKRGNLYTYDATAIGTSEDDAVATLIKDRDLLLAITTNVKKLGK